MTLQDTFLKFSELYCKHAKVYKFNILSEQQGHIVENSHTNILIKLLSYEEDWRHPFLDSFSKAMFPTWNQSVDGDVEFKKESSIEITDDDVKKIGRIDGFITKEGEFAIIIENKINGAADQEDQLKKYIIDTIENKKFSIDKVWVIYLTSVGGDPSKDECKGIEEVTGWKYVDNDYIDNEHYAAISYRDDILPWLKDEVLPNIKMKDISLFAGVSQYIEFLDEMFSADGLSDNLIEETAKLLDEYLKSRNIVSYKAKVEALHDFFSKDFKDSKTSEEINAFLSIVEKYSRRETETFARVTKEYFTNIYGAECHIHSHFCNYYINIYNKNWGKHIYFAWSPNSLKTIEEGKELSFAFRCDDKEVLECLKDYLDDHEFESVDKIPTEYRRKVNVNMQMYNINEEVLKGIYKQLVPKDFVDRINRALSLFHE